MHNKTAAASVIIDVSILNQHLVAIVTVSHNITIVVVLIINALAFRAFQITAVIRPMQFVFWHSIFLKAVRTLQVKSLETKGVGVSDD